MNNTPQAQSTKKRQQFSISIRRKQVIQKLQAMRSQMLSEVQTNFQKFYPIIDQINNQQKAINQCLKQLKILSYSAQPAELVFKAAIHHKLYAYLSQKAQQMSASQYSDILTILINLCVHVQLDLSGQMLQVVATSILKPDRQMPSLWLLANIIYQKSQFSGAVARQLVQKCNGLEYMENRYIKKFINQGDIVIFNFFCCAFLVVSSYLSASHVKRIYDVIEEILKYQHKSQENYWFLSQALVDHGAYIGIAEYEIFGTQIINKFGYYCKNKKTKYVKNYLKMLIAFTTYDKLAYEKLLKYQIFKHLDFCLQNRFPEIKKLCADVGSNLLLYFGDKVDIENIGFFQQLVLEILNLQKHTQDAQISITKYCVRFFTISGMNKVTKQSKQKFINDILSTNLIPIVSSCLVNSNGNVQLINQIIHLLFIFTKLDQSYNRRVINRCKNQRMVQYLGQVVLGNNNLAINNEELFNTIQRFLQILH